MYGYNYFSLSDTNHNLNPDTVYLFYIYVPSGVWLPKEYKYRCNLISLVEIFKERGFDSIQGVYGQAITLPKERFVYGEVLSIYTRKMHRTFKFRQDPVPNIHCRYRSSSYRSARCANVLRNRSMVRKRHYNEILHNAVYDCKRFDAWNKRSWKRIKIRKQWMKNL